MADLTAEGQRGKTTIAKETTVAITEDYKKYYCAMGARNVRRLAAKIQHAGIAPELIAGLMEDLVEVIHLQRAAALVGWPCADDADEVAIDFSAYSDGQPVSTTVDWGSGHATTVNHPDALVTSDVGALLPEYWPCGHRPAHPTLDADD